MAKLDKHAELIKQLYDEFRNAQGTYEQLRLAGIQTCYESVRSWLRRHENELTLHTRSGGGRPKSDNPEQLFAFIPDNPNWVPSGQIYPGLLLIFTEKASPEIMNGVLFSFLKAFGVEISVDCIEEAELPLPRFRCLCDLEIYFLAYLLGHHGALVGVTEDKFGERIRAITPKASRLRKIIMRRSSISVGELRELIRRPQ